MKKHFQFVVVFHSITANSHIDATSSRLYNKTTKTMIDKKDLRIGNRVMFEGKILTVKAIEHNPVTDRWYVKVYENYSQIKCEYLEPIPLTEELLVKCPQFEVQKCLSWSTGKEVKYNVYLFDKFEYNAIQDNWYYETNIIEIKHLHKLQNCIQDFTNTELTINL